MHGLNRIQQEQESRRQWRQTLCVVIYFKSGPTAHSPSLIRKHVRLNNVSYHRDPAEFKPAFSLKLLVMHSKVNSPLWPLGTDRASCVCKE